VVQSKLGGIPNCGRSESGAQSGRKNPPACDYYGHCAEGIHGAMESGASFCIVDNEDSPISNAVAVQ